MPAWLWITAAAAVAFVLFVAWGRHWLAAVWYSWQRAAHAYADVEAEYGDAPVFYGSMTLADERALHHEDEWPVFMPAPPPECWPDWREQTAADLAPEALDDEPLSAPPHPVWRNPRLRDPGPGDVSSSTSPGPVPERLCGPEQPHEKPAGTESAGSGHPDRWEWHRSHRPGEALGPRACAVLDRYERRLGARMAAAA